MSYDLIQFIADCQTSLKRNPGPAGREKVRADLKRLRISPSLPCQAQLLRRDEAEPYIPSLFLF